MACDVIDLERARVDVVGTRLAAGLAADESLLPDLEAGVSFERERNGERSTGPTVSVALPLSGREAADAASALASAREAEDLVPEGVGVGGGELVPASDEGVVLA